jgi:hypothetical protein
MLNLRLLYGYSDHRILAHPVDPIVSAKKDQTSGYSLIESARRDFDGVFHAVRVATRNLASAKTHKVILAFRFSFAKSLTGLRGRE